MPSKRRSELVKRALRLPPTCDPFRHLVVVDFLREGTRGELGPARALFKTLPRQPHAISVFALCELLAGAAQASRGDQEREKVRSFCSRLRTVYPNEGFAEDYGSLVGTLKRSGRNPRAMEPREGGGETTMSDPLPSSGWVLGRFKSLPECPDTVVAYSFGTTLNIFNGLPSES
jgi:hypothetical protein